MTSAAHRGEVGRPGPGVEAAFEAEVDRVGPVLDGRGYTYSIARRGKQFQRAIGAQAYYFAQANQSKRSSSR